MLTHPRPKQSSQPTDASPRPGEVSTPASVVPTRGWRRAIPALDRNWARLWQREPRALMRVSVVALIVVLIAAIVAGVHASTTNTPARVPQVAVPAHQV